jgi:hypothetical protein
LATLAACAPAATKAAANLETFVMAVGGESTYFTFGAPAPVGNFFAGGGVFIPSNPAGLAASNVAGGYEQKDTANNPLVDSTSINVSYPGGFTGTETFSGSTAGTANYGSAGAEAHGVFSGWGDNVSVAGTEAYGLSTDSYAFSSPSVPAGTQGYVNFHFTVDGNPSSTGTAGTAEVQVSYQQDSGPLYSLMQASVDPRFAPAFSPSSGPGHDGFTISPTSISGSGVFDADNLTFIWGSSFDLKLGLLAFVLPERDNTADVNFNSTAQLTGIDAFAFLPTGQGGNSWQQVASFSVTSGSGTFYDAAGVHLLPGDVNHDHIVNGQDIALVASHWLQSATGVSGDATGDGIVNGQDIALIASHWLQTDGSGGGGAAVPEPSTIVPVALAGLSLLAHQRPALQSRKFWCFSVGGRRSVGAL